ncbi:MAG: biotin--[acetyl-CoA-carboxylase] ligase [Candidatus Hydrothermarchaeota archaeon]
MRKKILEALKNKKGSYVSGEELSKKLGISRTAIWKHVNALKEEGYLIESYPKLGYRLIEAPDLFFPEEIKENLKTEFLGNEIYYFKEIGSTMDYAKDLGTKGIPEGALVISEIQTKGRGRLSREWQSPFGGIWLSLLLRPKISPVHAPKITLLSGIAVTKTIKKECDLDARLKWPNDVIINGKKVCGILTEISAEIDRINFVVVGIGINVNNELPKELERSATTIRKESKRSFSRLKILKSLLEEFESLYVLFKKNQTFIVDEWKKYSDTLNKPVRITTPDRVIEGLALDIDEEGRLIVKTNESVERIVSGDCTYI